VWKYRELKDKVSDVGRNDDILFYFNPLTFKDNEFSNFKFDGERNIT